MPQTPVPSANLPRPRYSVALELYEFHLPLFMGQAVPHERFDLEFLNIGGTIPGRDGMDRHARMLFGHEFDVAEYSLAGFIIARSRGSRMTGVPVFPRRLFSQNHIWVRRDAGIETPADLIGRRVAIRAFQVTLTVLARGDLARHYGLPLDQVQWVVQRPEHQQFDFSGLQVEAAPEGVEIADLLLSGAVDALIDPAPPLRVLEARDLVRPLFADPQAESLRHFHEVGYFPLMHLLALRPGLAEAEPDLPRHLRDVWEGAKAATHVNTEDYAWSLSPLGRYAIEADRERFGPDPWPSGVEANRASIEDFTDYLLDQRLIERRIGVEELFEHAWF